MVIDRPEGPIARELRCLWEAGTLNGLSEGEILDRFLRDRDERAFGVLVDRHGPMVLRTCRSLLGDHHRAEDAFQATFLVLARRGGSIRDAELLGPWLHRVARRVSSRALAESSRRRRRERPSTDSLDLAVAPESRPDPDRLAIVEEVDRLPEHYRRPVILCDLQGLTHAEAASRLGWPIGTVKGRQSRARDLLRRRLTRRGLAAGSILLARPLDAAPSAALVARLLPIAAAFAARRSLTAAAVPATLIPLTRGVLLAMTIQKSLAGLAVGLASLTAVAAGLAAFAGQQPDAPDLAGDIPGVPALETPEPAAAAPEIDPNLAPILGNWERIEHNGAPSPEGTATFLTIRPAMPLPLGSEGSPVLCTTTITPGPDGGRLTLREFAVVEPGGDSGHFDTLPFNAFFAGNEIRATVDDSGIWIDRQVADAFAADHRVQELRAAVRDLDFRIKEQSRRIRKKSDAALTRLLAERGRLIEEFNQRWEELGPIIRDKLEEMRASNSPAPTRLGIYQVKDNRLTLLLSPEDAPRPVSFSGNPDDGSTFDIFRRIDSLPEPTRDEPDASYGFAPSTTSETPDSDGRDEGTVDPDLASLLGAWVEVSRGGEPAPDPATHYLKFRPADPGVARLLDSEASPLIATAITTEVDGTTPVMSANTFVLVDPSQEPAWIDYVHPDTLAADGLGPELGRGVGIYRIEGDTLTIALSWGHEGQTRPTELPPPDLDGPLSSNVHVTVYRRLESVPEPTRDEPDASDGFDPTTTPASASTTRELDLPDTPTEDAVEPSPSSIGDLPIDNADRLNQLPWIIAETQASRAFEELSHNVIESTIKKKMKMLINDEVPPNLQREFQQQLDRLQGKFEISAFELAHIDRQIEEMERERIELATVTGGVTGPRRLAPGDVVRVEVLEALPGRPLTGERIVRPDGTITLEFYGDLRVAGMTRGEIKVAVIEHMRKFLRDEALGLVDRDPETLEEKQIAPAASNCVFVDDTQPEDRPIGIGPSPTGASGTLEERLSAIESTLALILKQTADPHNVEADESGEPEEQAETSDAPTKLSGPDRRGKL